MKKKVTLSFCCLLFSSVFYGQWSTSSTHIYNSNSGNVGIGTSSPSAGKLVISGSYPQLVLDNPTVGAGSFIKWQDNGSDAGVIGHLTTTTGLQLSGIDFSTPHMTILNNGNVGIGTTNPAYKLDVNGSTNFRGNLLINDNGVYLTNGGDYLAGAGGSGNSILYTRGQLTLSSNGNNIGQSLLLQNNGSTSLAIIPGGNVGIGTISPSEKLSVNGNISAKKMIVTQTGWSDYVFDEKYTLRSLTSLETFIQQNKHLPEVPSVKEVEEKGVDVGSTQTLLLKKIEELTLYVIQQQKEMNEFKNKITRQERLINTLVKNRKK